MRILFAFALFASSVFAMPQKLILPKHTQMIIVTSNDYNSSDAKLQRYTFVGSKWQKIGKVLDIKIGKNGMGWGLGLHKTPSNTTIIKKEGDGKSPIGIFELGDAFGYEPFDVKYPYSVMKEYHHCVDDGKSIFYNQIINSNMKIVKDYVSYENMKLPANYYKYGVVVKHNPNNIPGMGSCIFMHIKSIPTTGCDAMSEDEMKEIIYWIKKEANPILVQAPKSEIDGLLKQVK